MAVDLEHANRAMRRGAVQTFAFLGILLVALVVTGFWRVVAPDHWRYEPLSTGFVALILAWVFIAHGRGAWRLYQMRLTPEGIEYRNGRNRQLLHWADVQRLRLDSRHITLESGGRPTVVVPLQYVTRPNEVRERISAQVPTEALRGPTA